MQTGLRRKYPSEGKMQKMNIPMLILDGDVIDKRNSHDGQIKTRLEAFLELIGTGEKTTC